MTHPDGTDPRPPAEGADAPLVSDEADPLTSDEATEELRACPACGNTTGAGQFCEACGTQVDREPEVSERSGGMLVLGTPEAAESSPDAAGPDADAQTCEECGGGFLDGYCEQCGSPRPDPRDHTEDPAADWVAGVCDVGIQHRFNQDAMALAVAEDRAALVVCDGVSSALRSEDASQAAADAAVAVLSRATSTGVGVPSALVPALSSRLDSAADAAADAVADVTDEVHRDLEAAGTDVAAHSNPSCTFVAAAIEGAHVVVGSVGDSRAYWFPDAGEAVRLTRDDSVAEERVDLGVPRAEAETGPGSHTITRWMGVDSPDHTPRKAPLDVETPGWLLLCSDGLWNYASEPADLAAVLADVAVAGTDETEEADTHALTRIAPLTLARGLVTWAKAKGGHDNITVIAARLQDERKAASDG